MDSKRQIRGEQHNVAELVQNAIAQTDSQPLNLEAARKSLSYLGNSNPTDEMVTRYARESAILRKLAVATGAFGFEKQIGKIDFSTTDNAVASVNAYLNRRIQGNRARWTANHR